MQYETKDEREEAEGFVALEAMNDSEYHCPIDEFRSLHAAWTRGEAFLETKTMYDEPITIKASRIQTITTITPQTLATRKLGDRIRKEKELTE